MISVYHKCIFIHVQRTGGTTIERWIQGEDQWNLKSSLKHITTGYAKLVAHSEYYDQFFKFAFVRNPYEHVVSQLMGAKSYGGFHLSVNEETPEESFLKIDPIKYYSVHCFGGSLVWAHSLYEDHNFNEPHERIPNSIYQNIFASGVDKIYKFEEYDDAIDDIALNLGIESPRGTLLKHGARPEGFPQVDQLKPKDFEVINELYGADFEKYGYEMRFV